MEPSASAKLFPTVPLSPNASPWDTSNGDLTPIADTVVQLVPAAGVRPDPTGRPAAARRGADRGRGCRVAHYRSRADWNNQIGCMVGG